MNLPHRRRTERAEKQATRRQRREDRRNGSRNGQKRLTLLEADRIAVPGFRSSRDTPAADPIPPTIPALLSPKARINHAARRSRTWS